MEIRCQASSLREATLEKEKDDLGRPIQSDDVHRDLVLLFGPARIVISHCRPKQVERIIKDLQRELGAQFDQDGFGGWVNRGEK